MRVVHVDLNGEHGAAVAEDEAVAGAVVAIGNFDGLHRGHQALFRAVHTMAAARSAPRGIVTFDPHPVRVLAAKLAPPLILRQDEKLAGLAAAGMDITFVVRFTPAVAALAPEAFVRVLLRERLGVAGVVVGEGFRFGHRAAGGVKDLQAGMNSPDDVTAVAAVREGGYVCSSSKIRELILQGHVEAAASLLGRPYELEGAVVTGDGRGRTIGVPTANIDSHRELLPKVGVYATRALLDDGQSALSVTNVGLRPTFQGEGVRVEAHLLDFEGDLYGRRVHLQMVARLREEQRFSGVDALKAQIQADIVAARAALLRHA
jgi:riboflavin kinase/FMN adenylyltransferase